VLGLAPLLAAWRVPHALPACRTPHQHPVHRGPRGPGPGPPSTLDPGSWPLLAAGPGPWPLSPQPLSPQASLQVMAGAGAGAAALPPSRERVASRSEALRRVEHVERRPSALLVVFYYLLLAVVPVPVITDIICYLLLVTNHKGFVFASLLTSGNSRATTVLAIKRRPAGGLAGASLPPCRQ
jgi:hypothetical protein